MIQTTQTSSRTLTTASGARQRLGFIATVQRILRKDGLAALWRGLGPALVLVINPVLQYTVFEQLKNTLIRRRTARMRAAASGTAAAAALVAVLSDVDYFFLGALAKLGAESLSSILFIPWYTHDRCVPEGALPRAPAPCGCMWVPLYFYSRFPLFRMFRSARPPAPSSPSNLTV